MKNAVTNYENVFYFNGAALSGVLSVDGSYNVEYKPINAIGHGFVKQIITSVPSATLNVSRYLTNNDAAFTLTGTRFARKINGGLYYLNKYFGFEDAYLNSLGVSCSVGEIPKIETSFNVYGDIGPGFNPSGAKYAGGVFVPQVKDINLVCRNSSTNRVTSFSVDFSTPKLPIYGLSASGAHTPISVQNVLPIEVTSTFSLEIDDYETKRLFQDLTANGTTDFSIHISGTVLEDIPLTEAASGENLTVSSGAAILYSFLKSEDKIPIFNFSNSNATIVSEQINSTAEDVLSVKLSYKTFLN